MIWKRNYLTVVLAVALLHVGFIWALQPGMTTPGLPSLAPIMVVRQVFEPAPSADAVSPPSALPLQAPKASAGKSRAPALLQPPQPSDRPLPATELANKATEQPAVSGIVAVSAAAVAVSISDAAGSLAAPAKASVQWPVSDADYLQNSPPPYPVASVRFNEQGRTTVRVLIAANGRAERAEIAKSSGYKRLDDAAVSSVMRWRYVPGKRGGVAEPMWFEVPINWTLQ